MQAAREFQKRRAVEVRTAGRYSLASRYDGTGKRREFACRTKRISPFQVLVSAPVLGPKGERVIAYFGEFGKLDGFISDIVDGGFLLYLAVNKSQREKLANKLQWIEKRQKDPTVVDVREQQRIIPEDPHTTLMFADGTVLTCFVIDVSTSGVAVSADIEPEIGTRVAVGRTVGSVVRLFVEGFAVRFDELQHPDRLEIAIKPTAALITAAELALEAPTMWYLD